MKIVHICLASFFPDGFSYQENILPKFHKRLGYDVEVIASLVTFDEDGKVTLDSEPRKYHNEYNIPVTRLGYRWPIRVFRKLRRYEGFREVLEASRPDVLFIHGCQFMDIKVVANYVKEHNQVSVYVDNHADFSNSAKNWLSKNVLHKVIWRRCAHIIAPYTKKFYGVLPARVDFLKDIYRLPAAKCELLAMGADDDEVHRAGHPDVIRLIREKHNIEHDDFLIVTGGKINQYKKQTLLLMQAVAKVDRNNVKLIVFGAVSEELKAHVNNLCDGIKVQYIGWIQAETSYDYFAAANLVVFPGRHSVFWEQVVGQGIPMVVKEWAGTKHVDFNGNVMFLTKDTVEEIYQVMLSIIDNPDNYQQMQKIAHDKGMLMFSYKDIARRSIAR